MKEPLDQRLQRVQRLLRAARRVADPQDSIGRRARAVLPPTTGLSPAGVELALAQCLETDPGEAELRALCAAVPSVPRSHVLLSANVFVAAHRAIALALAASVQVEVRPSRRELAMASLLRDAEPSLFRIVDELAPLPGDHIWAHGSDRTLEALRSVSVAGAVLHAYGTGIGIAAVQPSIESDQVASHELQAAAEALAQDVVPFDQRGCLSPRVAVVLGSAAAAREFASGLAQELARLEFVVPRGLLTVDEAADAVRYRDTMLYAADCLPAGKGCVGLDAEQARVLLPPPGRHVHVVSSTDLAGLLTPLVPVVTAVGCYGPHSLYEQLQSMLPDARCGELGQMQRPPFDGPVDRRPDPNGEIL